METDASKQKIGRFRSLTKRLSSFGRRSSHRSHRSSNLPPSTSNLPPGESSAAQPSSPHETAERYARVMSLPETRTGGESSTHALTGSSSLPSTRSLTPYYTWLSTLGGVEDERIAFYTQLATLTDDCLFAGRYKIGSERIQGKPHCRTAVEKSSGRPVFLKFVPRDSAKFENVVQIYSALADDQRHVCRLYEILENVHRFPPCLVLEKGHRRLSERMARRRLSSIEQRAILNSVLESLESLHSRGITHGNLTPDHIMWFPADLSWKLVDLEYASLQEGVIIRDTPPISRYTSPERIRAEEHGKGERSLNPSADMWSMGIVAFEILTSSKVVDANAVREIIDQRLGTPSGRSPPQRWLSINRRGRMKKITEDQILRFIQTLLREDPTERQTATHALEDALFRSATDVYQRFNTQETAVTDAMGFPDMTDMPDWAWIALLSTHLTLSVDMEYLPQYQTSDQPFYLQSGEKAWSFRDDYLLEHPVHYVKLKETYRLHIRVTSNVGHGIAPQRLNGVFAKPADSECVPLTVEQRHRDDAVVALALFEPWALGSPRLQKISPHMGDIEQKYVRVDIFIKVVAGGTFSRELDYHTRIYCKTIDSKNKLRFHRMIGMVEKEGVLRRHYFELE